MKKPFPVRILMSTIFRVGSVSTHADNILMTKNYLALCFERIG